MNFDKALTILRNHNNGLTDRQEEERKILVAAIDNLVDFATAEEYQMISSLPDELEESETEDYEELCEQYNLFYAGIENTVVDSSAEMAFFMLGASSMTYITYMTQQDERVRDSHAALDGATYLKSEFPEDMIPPIDWCCRCYLDSDGSYSRVHADASDIKKIRKELVNPVFSESLSMGGRIFGPKHRYFQIQEQHQEKLNGIAQRIKDKFYTN